MIPIAIVAHPSRTKWVTALNKAVQADAICWDSQNYGATANHLLAWEWLASSGEEWAVVLEDDVIPCKNFRTELRDAIQNAPTDALSLYLGRGRPPGININGHIIPVQQKISAAIVKDVSYITFPRLFSGQGYALKTRLFAQHESLRDYIKRGKKPIDESIGSWLARRQGVDVSYCRFSLVDHRDGPTLIDDHGDGQPRNGKTALWVEGCAESGKDLPEVRKAWLMSNGDTDWTRGSVPLCDVNRRAKLTEDDVRAIKAQKGKSLQEIADLFGVKKSTIGDILSGRTWKHVS